MKSKIVALSKNQDFKNLLKERKISNKYLTIYFGKLSNKDIFFLFAYISIDIVIRSI